MKLELLNRLRCPNCQAILDLRASQVDDHEVRTGELKCATCVASYPISDHIPRFVPADNYAQNFGFQWNRFRRTQLDSFSGQGISRQRFFSQSGWSPDELRGKWVLDVGCGAGRFAEIALSCGAKVVAVDYSSAVDACRKNHGLHGDFHVVQASVYELPFAAASFDYVYCFGVLQHTPDVHAALAALPPQLRAGGKLAVDVYAKLPLGFLWPKHWLRPWTKRLPSDRLFKLTETMVKLLLPLSKLLGRVPLAGRKLRHLVPVLNYEGVLPLNAQQIRDWALLDTFDMLSAAHDNPQTSATVDAWCREAGLNAVQTFRQGHVIARGTRPVGNAKRQAA